MAVAATATTSLTVDGIVGMAMVTAGVLNEQHYASGNVPPASLLVGRTWLFMKLQSLKNSGVILRARDFETKTITSGVAYVAASADTLSVEDGVIVTTSEGIDRSLQLINESEYQLIADKASAGIPTQAFPRQQADGTWRVYMWPVPENGEPVSITYPRTRRLKDVEVGSVNLDLNPNMYLFIVSWLAMRFASAKGRKDSAAELREEAEFEQGKAESDETERGESRFVVDDLDIF